MCSCGECYECQIEALTEQVEKLKVERDEKDRICDNLAEIVQKQWICCDERHALRTRVEELEAAFVKIEKLLKRVSSL